MLRTGVLCESVMGRYALSMNESRCVCHVSVSRYMLCDRGSLGTLLIIIQ